MGFGGMRLLREYGPLAGFALMFAFAFAHLLLRRASRPKLPKTPLHDEDSPGPLPPTRRQLKQAKAFLAKVETAPDVDPPSGTS